MPQYAELCQILCGIYFCAKHKLLRTTNLCKIEWNDDKVCQIAFIVIVVNRFHFHSLNLVQNYAGLCQGKRT